ncbi:unnamed protein product [Auanema sp. JU1783]|nr:unnamed protein product [Auanema sp. JU1783]
MSEDHYDDSFQYAIDSVNIRQGAEARVYDCTFLGKPAILKERFDKNYRHKTLNDQLNASRLKQELKCIMKAKQLGVRTPAVYFVDSSKNKFIMSKIPGVTAKEWIESNRTSPNFEKSLKLLGVSIGSAIGVLHEGGLVHGDLTTSNIILENNSIENPVLIDFGLASQGKMSSEDQCVDLYVLERAIASTHRNCEYLLDGIWEGYKNAIKSDWELQHKKLEEIRQRGRKRDMVG